MLLVFHAKMGETKASAINYRQQRDAETFNEDEIIKSCHVPESSGSNLWCLIEGG